MQDAVFPELGSLASTAVSGLLFSNGEEASIWMRRAEYVALASFMAWSLRFQPVNQSFAAHPSFSQWAKLVSVGNHKHKDKTETVEHDPCSCFPVNTVAWTMFGYVAQLLMAFAIWVYWNNPWVTSPNYHMAVLSAWFVNGFLSRMAYSLYPLTESHLVFRIVLDSLIFTVDLLIIIMVTVELAIRHAWMLFITVGFMTVVIILDGIILGSILKVTCVNAGH